MDFPAIGEKYVLSTDICVVGASYAGLACASAAASQGMKVTVLEAKSAVGLRPHTTGILVQEAMQQLPSLPASLVRPIQGVRVYAPSLRSFDLHAKDYAFFAADTPGLLQWMAAELLQHPNVTLRTQSRFQQAHPHPQGWQLPDQALSARYLVGADGARSAVAQQLGLGRNTRFLVGMELEFAGHAHLDDRFLHVFMDSELAPGYIAWVVPGLGITQVGLACKYPGQLEIEQLLVKLQPLFDFSTLTPLGRRGGLIPVGGAVQPMYCANALLVGDAAGMVSPLTAGGIHKSLELGHLAGASVAAYLQHQGKDPGRIVAAAASRYRVKRHLRTVANWGLPNALLEGVFGNVLFKRFAQLVFFHHQGLMNAQGWKAAWGVKD